MNFEFFQLLSRKEAEIFFNNYIEIEKTAISELIIDVSKSGIKADFSMSSLPDVLSFIFKKIKTVPKDIDETLPAWITECDTYIGNLFDFDEPSKILILRAAYYFGECFTKFSDSLSWSIGDRDTALQNMPVITGFDYKMELPPLLVIENTFGSVVSEKTTEDEFKKVIDTWISKIP